jgi:hypothetical protein
VRAHSHCYAHFTNAGSSTSSFGFAVNAHGFILRAMKRAAGRPQDLEDLRRLGED